MSNHSTKTKSELIAELQKLEDAYKLLEKANISRSNESERKYRLITESMKDVVWIQDPHTLTFLYVSPSCESLHGYKPEELIGQKSDMFISSDAANKIISELRRASKDGENKNHISDSGLSDKFYTRELEVKKKDGTPIWLEIVIRFIRDEISGKIEILGVSRDISDRKKAEGAIRKSEAKFHSLYASMIDGSALHTLLYNEHGVPEDYRIIDVNPAFENQLGIPRESVIGKTSREAYGVEEPPFFEIYSRVASTGRPEVFESYFAPLDKYFSISVYRPYTDSFATIFENITERKKTEAELRIKHEQLQKLNVEKDKLFTIIAHDLKSPFSAIVGFSELLLDQIKEQRYEGMEKSVEIIQRSSNKAMDLLMNLMEWARTQTGRMEFSPKFFDMVDHINEIEEIFEIIASQKFIKIHKELPQKAPAYADKAMVSAILRNLISNAIKFSEPHGEVIISVNANTEGLVISVKDNGVGICSDNIGKLFKIDESVSTLGTNGEKGTGFGLILCKEFVEKHGGVMWVESEEGLGSAFYFTLPYF